MDWLNSLLNNAFFVIPVVSWLIAQVLKALINAVINQKFDLERLFGDGGMPSGHSATVTSLATTAWLVYGPGSFQFAVCGVLAIIVCHDAMGVRRETDKQNQLLNEITKSFELLIAHKLPDVNLKEFVGHSPSQVGAGILLGIVNSLCMYYLLFV